ncbi:hypothetical protein B0H14DRAFT_3521462 [Mycena olivaceomarginata]|nr:hypothetical protein B0H14DRAFT_3521462 [Mycena olivaceomarginata]
MTTSVLPPVTYTFTPTPTWCVYSDAPTPAPLSLVFFSGSGHLPVASIAPTQRLRFILTSSLLDPMSRNRVHRYTHRWPLALAPPSGPRLPAHPSHAMLPPQLSPPSSNSARSRPRIGIPPTAPPISLHLPHLCLCLSARVSLEMLPLSPILHAAAFASTANPACLRGARERGCARAILARVGSDSTTAREWIRQQLWTSDSEFSLPPRTPLRFQSPILSSFLAPTPASIFRAHREHECDRTHSFLGADSLTRA